VESEMSNVTALNNLDRVAKNLVGKEVARPDKTMGHASGLEFEKLVHKEIVNKFIDDLLDSRSELTKC
jgi:hypothetical protein